MKDFELLPHTADLKIRVYGNDLNSLFVHALQGMFQAIKPKIRSCTGHHDRIVCPLLPSHRNIHVQAPTLEMLLVDFLSEALSLSDIHNEAYLDATVGITETFILTATVYGIAVEGFDVVEIKAVTYHDLHIEQHDSMWQVDIVCDI